MAGPARRTTGSTMPDRASFFGMETSSATGRSRRHPLSWQPRRLTKSRKLRGSGDNLYALRDQHEQALRQWRAIADKA
jgi:hypothetical protein